MGGRSRLTQEMRSTPDRTRLREYAGQKIGWHSKTCGDQQGLVFGIEGFKWI